MISALAIALIRFYQRFISPLLGPRCRFYPTCSEYALISISEWGILKGSRLTLLRLLKCGPWNDGGYDPPPLRLSQRGESVNPDDSVRNFIGR